MRDPISKLLKFSFLGVLIVTPVSLVSLTGCGGGGGGGSKPKPTATPTASPTVTPLPTATPVPTSPPFSPPTTPPAGVFNLYFQQNGNATFEDLYRFAIGGRLSITDSGNLLDIQAYRNDKGNMYRTHEFAIRIRHSEPFKVGDTFSFEGANPPATASAARGIPLWRATSGHVKVLSRSDTLLYLQIDSLFVHRQRPTATVNVYGTLQIPLTPTAG